MAKTLLWATFFVGIMIFSTGVFGIPFVDFNSSSTYVVPNINFNTSTISSVGGSCSSCNVINNYNNFTSNYSDGWINSTYGSLLNVFIVMSANFTLYNSNDSRLDAKTNSIGNWSQDKGGLPNISLANVNTNMGNWSQDKPQFAQLVTLSNTTSSVAWTSLFTFAVLASKNYTLDCTLFVASNSTAVGNQFNLTTPANIAWVITSFDHPTTAVASNYTVMRNSTANAAIAGHTDLATTSSLFPAMLQVKIRSNINLGGTAGNVVLYTKSEVAGSCDYVDRGSFCSLTLR